MSEYPRMTQTGIQHGLCKLASPQEHHRGHRDALSELGILGVIHHMKDW